MRYLAFSTVHGLSLAYGDTAQEARDAALAQLQIASDRYVVVVDCGVSGPVIWQEMTLLDLVRQHRPIVALDSVAA